MLLLASTAHLGYECMDGWMDCCHKGTAIQRPLLDRIKPSFVIFNIRALWRSGLSVKNYKWRLNPVWYRMLYSCLKLSETRAGSLSSSANEFHTVGPATGPGTRSCCRFVERRRRREATSQAGYNNGYFHRSKAPLRDRLPFWCFTASAATACSISIRHS